MTLDSRLRSRIVMEDGCWLFQGAAQSSGYMQVSVEGRKVLAHRHVYQTLVAPIPAGLELDHLCRQRRCVNPAHLEPVTHAENTRRARAEQTHCREGHPLSGENVRIVERKDGRRRICRTCRAAALRRYRERVAA